MIKLTNRFHVPWVITDHRWRQNVVKTMKWHTSRRRSVSLLFLPHFDVLCDLLLNRPTATWNLFVLYNDQKRKKTDTHTCLVPLDCWNICASLDIFKVPNAIFRLSFFLFSLSHLYTVSSKSFSTSFLAQSRIMAKTFCKTASLSQRWNTIGSCCEDFL